jgi:ankyrin repeat protein
MSVDELKRLCKEHKIEDDLYDIITLICEEQKSDWIIINLSAPDIMATIFEKACEIGNMKIFHIILDMGFKNYDKGLGIACQYKRYNIIDILIKLGIKNYNSVLYGACMGGHLDIINRILSLSNNFKYMYGLNGACKGGHKNIIDMMIKLGADKYDDGLLCACEKKHKDIAEQMINLGIKNLNKGLAVVCRHGYTDLAVKIIKLGAKDFNGALRASCANNDKKFAQYLLDTGKVDDINRGLHGACESRNIDMVKWMLSKGANDYTGGMGASCDNKFFEGIDLFMKYEDEIDMGMIMEEFNEDLIIIKYTLEKGYINFGEIYDYTIHKQEIINLIELGLDIKYLKDVYGYNKLMDDYTQYKTYTKKILGSKLLAPIISIINSYSIL